MQQINVKHSIYKAYSCHFMKHSQYSVVGKYSTLFGKNEGIFRKRTVIEYISVCYTCIAQHTALLLFTQLTWESNLSAFKRNSSTEGKLWTNGLNVNLPPKLPVKKWL